MVLKRDVNEVPGVMHATCFLSADGQRKPHGGSSIATLVSDTDKLSLRRAILRMVALAGCEDGKTQPKPEAQKYKGWD